MKDEPHAAPSPDTGERVQQNVDPVPMRDRAVVDERQRVGVLADLRRPRREEILVGEIHHHVDAVGRLAALDQCAPPQLGDGQEMGREGRAQPLLPG